MAYRHVLHGDALQPKISLSLDQTWHTRCTHRQDRHPSDSPCCHAYSHCSTRWHAAQHLARGTKSITCLVELLVCESLSTKSVFIGVLFIMTAQGCRLKCTQMAASSQALVIQQIVMLTFTLVMYMVPAISRGTLHLESLPIYTSAKACNTKERMGFLNSPGQDCNVPQRST